MVFNYVTISWNILCAGLWHQQNVIFLDLKCFLMYVKKINHWIADKSNDCFLYSSINQGFIINFKKQKTNLKLVPFVLTKYFQSLYFIKKHLKHLLKSFTPQQAANTYLHRLINPSLIIYHFISHTNTENPYGEEMKPVQHCVCERECVFYLCVFVVQHLQELGF